MSKRNAKRVLATVLAFTMMWGMCISASAATVGEATSCYSAVVVEGTAYQTEQEQIEYTILDTEGFDINELPAGLYIDEDNEGVWDAEIDAYNELVAAFGNCDNSDTEAWGQNCECQEKYEAWVDAVRAFEAVILVSDGSKYVEYDGPCGDVVVSESKADDKDDNDDDDEVVIVKTVENDMGTFMDVSKNDITTALNSLNQAIAAGDTQAAQNIRVTGVTVDTGVWHSFNVGVYEQIENAGIPVTLKFTYAGVRYSVTIPAGAKVTELCDENGWCGFLNLAAHYGFEVL